MDTCDGPVPVGAIVPNDVGAHTFTVTGTDAAGNTATATHGYVVFEDIGGPITNQAVFKAGRMIPIILELGSRPRGRVFANGFPLVRAVDCATHESIGSDVAANVKATLMNNGRLLLRWQTEPGWAARADRSSCDSDSTIGPAPTPRSRSASSDADRSN